MQLILSLIKGMGIREIVKYLQKNGYKVVRFTGTEINKDVRVQWKDSDMYGDLKEEDYKKGALTLKNSFPLWLFVETEKYTYNKIIARIFNEAALEDNIYPQLQPDDLP